MLEGRKNKRELQKWGRVRKNTNDFAFLYNFLLTIIYHVSSSSLNSGLPRHPAITNIVRFGPQNRIVRVVLLGVGYEVYVQCTYLIAVKVVEK